MFKNFFKNVFNLQVKDQYISMMSIFLIFIVLWLCTICNFKILDIIGILVDPAVVFLLYILPIIVIYKNIKYKQYHKVVLDSILVIMGLVIIFGYMLGLLIK